MPEKILELCHLCDRPFIICIGKINLKIGKTACTLYGLAGGITGLCSLWTLVFIGYDRYITTTLDGLDSLVLFQQQKSKPSVYQTIRKVKYKEYVLSLILGKNIHFQITKSIKSPR